MCWILFLLTVFLNGYIFHRLFFSEIKGILRIASIFVIGSFLSVNCIYLLSSFLIPDLSLALTVYFCASFLFYLILGRKDFFREIPHVFLSINKQEGILLLFFLLLGAYLFPKTFSYDTQASQFLIASNVYLDFGSHIPFIRSFSLGHNFPAEVPFFAGRGLVYHFMFDLYAGILEFLGLRIDISFNLISILAFACLLIYVYGLSNLIFKRTKAIGLLTVILCLFSSNLSFINFFKKYGLHLSVLSSIWNNSFYFDNANTPFDGSFMAAEFWNLNTFFNQRHLIFGLLFAFFVIYTVLIYQDIQTKKKIKAIVFLGLMLGLLPFWHTMVFLAICIILMAFLAIEPQMRKPVVVLLIVAAITAIPELFAIKAHSSNTIFFKPGFLTNENFTIANFTNFWVINLGISILTLAYGFISAGPKQKKLFLIFMTLFVVPNIFQFSSRFVFDDHKFFNLWILLINAFSAFAIISIYKKSIVGRVISVVFLIFLTLSGLISIMVTKNDVYTRMPDYPKNSFLNWVVENLPRDAVVATNGEIYDPVSITGRKIIIGRAHYIFVYGGNPDERLRQQEEILLGKNITTIKEIIRINNISYLILYKNNFAKNSKNYDIDFIEKEFKKIYEDEYGLVFKT